MLIAWERIATETDGTLHCFPALNGVAAMSASSAYGSVRAGQPGQTRAVLRRVAALNAFKEIDTMFIETPRVRRAGVRPG